MESRKKLYIIVLIILVLALFSGEINTKAAVVRVKMYDASTFYPIRDDMAFMNYGNAIVNKGGTDAWFVAKVELPNGASVKKIKLWAYDNYAGVDDICLWIVWTKPRLAEAADMNAGLCSTGNDTTKPRVFSTTEISPRLIANKNNTYHLVVRIKPGSVTDLEFWGADIVYVR